MLPFILEVSGNERRMLQPEKSPVPKGPQPRPGGRHISADDIDLPLPPQPPASPEQDRIPAPTATNRQLSKSTKRQPNQFRNLLIFGALLGLLAAGIWHFRGAASEGGHPNWNHVAAAREASSSQGTNVVMHRDHTGALNAERAIVVSSADGNPLTTELVRGALLTNDIDTAIAAVYATQNVGTGSQVKSPSLAQNTKMLTAVRDGNSKFYQLNIFDCCDEDGDVVDILVNGEHFTTVSLTNRGTTLSLPLTPGTTTVTLRGVHDGGGGITVSFRSSQGDFFCQAIGEGDEYHVGVIVK